MSVPQNDSQALVDAIRADLELPSEAVQAEQDGSIYIALAWTLAESGTSRCADVSRYARLRMETSPLVSVDDHWLLTIHEWDDYASEREAQGGRYEDGDHAVSGPSADYSGNADYDPEPLVSATLGDGDPVPGLVRIVRTLGLLKGEEGATLGYKLRRKARIAREQAEKREPLVAMRFLARAEAYEEILGEIGEQVSREERSSAELRKAFSELEEGDFR